MTEQFDFSMDSVLTDHVWSNVEQDRSFTLANIVPEILICLGKDACNNALCKRLFCTASLRALEKLATMQVIATFHLKFWGLVLKLEVFNF